MELELNEIIFFLGGCRSGKSRLALELCDSLPGDERVFLATCVPRDEEMRKRVARHQQERALSWRTVEAPTGLPAAIADHSREANVILVDCLTLWISNLLLDKGADENIMARIAELIQTLDSAECPVVLVSNEVGAGIVPEYEISRRFRDLVGSANQAVAAKADRVVLCVAGIPVDIKR